MWFAFYRCKSANKARYAVFKNAVPFNSTEASNKTGQHEAESTGIGHGKESPKHRHRCGSRDPSTGDTSSHKRHKGKGCKRHHKTSRAHNSTLPTQSSVLHSNKSSTLASNETRSEKKKSTRKHLTTHSQPQAAAPSQTPTLHAHPPTTIAAVTETTERHTQSHCCGPRQPVRGDTFQPHCKNCPEHKTTSPAPSTTAVKTPWLRQTTETPKKDFWSTVTTAATKLQTEAPVPKDSHLSWNITGQEPVSGAPVPSTHAERSLKLNIALHNLTGEWMQLLPLSPLLGRIAALEISLSRVTYLNWKF